MILKELYDTVDVEEVWESVVKFFEHDRYITKEKYKEFYERVRKLEPLEEVKMQLEIRKDDVSTSYDEELTDEELEEILVSFPFISEEDDTEEEDDIEETSAKEGNLYDVSGLEEGVSYAIELSPWRLWMSLNVDEVLKTYSKPDILALSSWEMTYIGWTYEEVESYKEELDKMMGDIKIELE